MQQICANNLAILSLGRQGENLVRQIVFDISDWESEYGNGTAELIYQRPKDQQPYPIVTIRNDNSLVWTVTSTDTYMASDYGKCELRYYVGDTLVKSKIWRTWVELAMQTPSEEAPQEPQKGWVDKVLSASVDAIQAAEKAEDAITKAPKIGDDSNWYIWDANKGVYVDTGICAIGNSPYIGANGNWFVGDEDSGVSATARGPAGKDGVDGKPGKDGVDGKDGYTPQKGVDYFDGAPGRDGRDGANGSDGHTPVKGIDYFTEEEVAEIEQSAARKVNVPVKDVQIDGTSAVVDGVVNIPYASDKYAGVIFIKGRSGSGMEIGSDGVLKAYSADTATISSRGSSRMQLSPSNLDYAVKAAMCDGKGVAWTAEEQAAARDRLAVENGSDFELLVDATLEEEANIFKVVFPRPVRECIYHIWFYNNNGANVIAQTKCWDNDTTRYYLLKYTSAIANGRGYALNGYFRYNGPISSRSVIGYASDSSAPSWTTDNPGNGNTLFMNYPTPMIMNKVDGLSIQLTDTSHLLNVGAKIMVWGR